MILDTSALIAILLDEPGADALFDTMLSDPVRVVSSMSVLEASCVLGSRRGAIGVMEFNRFLRESKVEVVPLDQEQVEIAQTAWLTYGKGIHPAGLNFGDLAAYALSVARQEPLLFVGDDFTKTDIRGADHRDR
jgi:ribonuclease VapC